MKSQTKLRVISAPAPKRAEPSIAAMLAAYDRNEAKQRELMARIITRAREEARAKGERGVITFDRIRREHGGR